MGEGDMVHDKPESSTNGNDNVEENTGDVMNNKEEHHSEMTEIEEDKNDDGKVEAHNMGVDEKEIRKTEEIEETVNDGEVVKEGRNNEANEENKEEDKQAIVEQGEVETMGEVMDNDVVKKTQEIGDKVEEEVDEMEDEERSEDPKPEKDMMKKRPRTKITKKEPVDKKQKPKTSNEANVKEHETSKEKKEEPKTPVTYTTDRPIRERKSVERLVATIEKDAAKEFHVEKGRGTALKDIPNVAYKLSRKKTDDTFRLLHNIIFGRRGKAAEFKNNMSRFSGFVWHDNEEKQTIKVKEKLDKIGKEKLVEFCDVFDLPVSKANTRKEDIIAKLIEFLMAPRATTELLADKEQSSTGKKRKRVSKSASERSSASKGSAKSSKKSESTSKKGKETKSKPDSEDESEDKNEEAHEDEDIDGVLEKSEDEMSERAESEEKGSESEESDEDKVKQKQGSAKSSVKKGSTEKAKTKRVTSKKSDPPPEKAPVKSPHSRTESDKATSRKRSSKKKDEIIKEKASTPKKSPSSVSTGKKVPKGKDKPKEAKLTPSDDELRSAICDLLKEVDFNTATFTDVLKLLAKRFTEDLTPRKSSVKLMIQEELTKLADSEDDEGDAEKDEKKASTQSVKV